MLTEDYLYGSRAVRNGKEKIGGQRKSNDTRGGMHSFNLTSTESSIVFERDRRMVANVAESISSICLQRTGF